MQVSYLLGIPCDQLLPAPAADKWAPHLEPLPESISGELQQVPQPTAAAWDATSVEAAVQTRKLGAQASNARVSQAQLRQPSDLILQLAAGSKAAQAKQTEGTPQGVSLNRPLQVCIPCRTCTWDLIWGLVRSLLPFLVRHAELLQHVAGRLNTSMTNIPAFISVMPPLRHNFKSFFCNAGRRGWRPGPFPTTTTWQPVLLAAICCRPRFW